MRLINLGRSQWKLGFLRDGQCFSMRAVSRRRATFFRTTSWPTERSAMELPSEARWPFHEFESRWKLCHRTTAALKKKIEALD
jgi:hypothetical protein